jgi:hypothetical protein
MHVPPAPCTCHPPHLSLRQLTRPLVPMPVPCRENKSLNVFNSRLVLATPDTATDGDFGRIEGETTSRTRLGDRVGPL